MRKVKFTNEQLREAVRKCKTRLDMKLNEAAEANAFDAIAAYGHELLNAVHNSDVKETFADFPIEDEDAIDISSMLNTDEDNLDEKGLEESKKPEGSKLQEGKFGRDHRQMIMDYKAEGGSNDVKEYRKWFYDQPEADAGLNPPSATFFRATYGVDGTQGSALGTQDPIEVAPVKVDPDYKPSTNLMNLIDACGGMEAMNQTVSAVESVEERYSLISVIARAVVRNKYNKHFYILAGDPGIGKTHIIKKVLKAEGRAEGPNKVPYLTGSVGKSKTSIYAFLWKYRDEDLIILDDCDQILRADGNPEVKNILKGAMEAETGYTVGCSDPIIRKNVSSLIKGGLDEDYFTGKSKLTEDEFVDDEDDGDDEGGLIPESWTFNCRIIFISNLTQSRLDPALFSRCEITILTLTHEEFMIRLADIIDDMDCGQKDGKFTEDEVKDAKALVLSIMGSIIEAGEHGQVMFGKRLILQPHFQFRTAKDLVSLWITMLRDEMENNPDTPVEELKNKLLKRWVRVCVIPKMSVSEDEFKRLSRM